MFVVVRGFNLAIIVVAQYITAIFIMSPNQSLLEVLLDRSLLVLIAASAVSIASGYIINNFYDSEKDSINRPQQVNVEKMVSQNTKLMLYFILNILVIIAASYVSFRAVLFFSVYIFAFGYILIK